MGRRLTWRTPRIAEMPPEPKRKALRHQRQHRLRIELFHAQGGRCFWCVEPVQIDHPHKPNGRHHPRYATLDHHPVLKRDGGRLVHGNAVVACSTCNNKRQRPGWLARRLAGLTVAAAAE